MPGRCLAQRSLTKEASSSATFIVGAALPTAPLAPTLALRSGRACGFEDAGLRDLVVVCCSDATVDFTLGLAVAGLPGAEERLPPEGSLRLAGAETARDFLPITLDVGAECPTKELEQRLVSAMPGMAIDDCDMRDLTMLEACRVPLIMVPETNEAGTLDWSSLGNSLGTSLDNSEYNLLPVPA